MSQVFLNYDAKSNAEYLMQYGFTLATNENDYVGLIASIGDDAPKAKVERYVSNSPGH